MGQGFSNYTDHLKSATGETHIVCVCEFVLKIPLVDFHAAELETRNQTGLSMQLSALCTFMWVLIKALF